MNTYSFTSCHHAGLGYQSGTRQGMEDGEEPFGVNGEMRKNPVYDYKFKVPQLYNL